MTYPIKAVVFDWAGTMVDFGCLAPVEALLGAFAAHGVTISNDEARRDMGRAKRDHVAALLADPDVRPRWTAAKGKAPEPGDVDRVYATLEPLMIESAARCAKMIPGAIDTARRLSELGVRIGSGTGYTREMMAAIIPEAAAQGYEPEVVVCAGETPSGRPAPLMTWKALIAMDAWPARNCVKIDDAPVGMQEGKLAGCWAIGLSASGNGVGLSPEELAALPAADRAARIARSEAALRAAGADFVVESVADIWPAFDAIAATLTEEAAQ